jgi:chromosomal replication initiation ATPase DnaA
MGTADPHDWHAILAHDDIEPLEVSGGTLRLLVREPVQLKYLQQRCQKQFTEAVQSVMRLLLAVRFVGEAELEKPAGISRSGSALTTGLSAASDSDEDMLISPDHSFENFVVGPGNRLAHAGAVAVARKPACAYNPFFVHAGSSSMPASASAKRTCSKPSASTPRGPTPTSACTTRPATAS